VDVNDRRHRGGGILGKSDFGVEIAAAALADDNIVKDDDAGRRWSRELRREENQ
jgi:hypothetical protein